MTPPRVLSITPTRDGLVHPSRRLPDKHSRLFCGKTLDEWTMIQLWSSQHVSRAIFICETREHFKRLAPLAEKYGIELTIRREELLHPHNDSGSLVVTDTLIRILADEYYSLLMTPFVISPVRPPGFFDMLVEEYMKRAAESGGDFTFSAPCLLGGWQSPISPWQLDEHGIATKYGPKELIRHKDFLYSCSQHWIAATWFHVGQMMKWFARIGGDDSGDYHPLMLEIPRWTDFHIDTEEDWEQCEYWFNKKILSEGEDCYEQYRKNWEVEK